MGFSLNLAFRYMRSRKRATISVSTVFAIVGVALGTAALAAVMSVTGGFRAEFRDKVLGVNGHVLVLKYSSDFRDYRDVMARVSELPDVIGVHPFVINPMMVTHGGRTATGVLVKGVDPDRLGSVLDLPRHIIEGSLAGLRVPGGRTAVPPESDEAPTTVDAASAASAPAMPRGVGPSPVVSAKHEPTESAAPSSLKEPELQLLPGDLEPGSLVPLAGYESELPMDDQLPEDIDPDPCAIEGQVLPGIIIGAALRGRLQADLGDCLQVTSPTIGYSFDGGALRPAVAKQFRVTGVFRAGFEQYDSKFVYTDLHEAQAFYRGGDTVTGVEMRVADIERTDEVVKQVEAKLVNKLYQVLDWKELNHGLFTALRIQQILMSLVLGLIILVAAFTVVATLIMVVLDKKKEIAVIKAMGASDWDLLRAFLYQGLIIGLSGMALGLSFGYVFCKWIVAYGFPLDPKVYFISTLPVKMRAGEFLLTGAFAVVACLAATVWPALHAARLRPAEAFREA